MQLVSQLIKKEITILCIDSHHSYKSFAKKAEVKFHPINASKGERVKGAFHIKHVNSTHNRIKKWIGNTFWGVSTKYLQQYLNWYILKEKIKNRSDVTVVFAEQILGMNTLKNFRKIQSDYHKLISTQC